MIDLEKLEKLLELMNRFGVDVIQADSKTERFAVAKNAAHAHFFERSGAPAPVITAGPAPSQELGFASSAASAGNAAGAQGSAASAPAASGRTAPPPPVPAGVVQKSELVGTFYRAASPTSASFTDVGKRVKKGQTLCIVEAMKIMNEIEAEFDGEIVEILVENGKPVEFGTPLFRIKPA
jgi:acetyl-CoA carboxylase biotin carboxyl carrier protein